MNDPYDCRKCSGPTRKMRSKGGYNPGSVYLRCVDPGCGAAGSLPTLSDLNLYAMDRHMASIFYKRRFVYLPRRAA